MKYKTLAELKSAIDSGLVPKEWSITIDNDSTSMYEETEEMDSKGDLVIESGERIFDGGMPEDLLAEALDLLRIPNSPA